MYANEKGHDVCKTSQPGSAQMKAPSQDTTIVELVVNLMAKVAELESDNERLRSRLRWAERRAADSYDWGQDVPREREGA